VLQRLQEVCFLAGFIFSWCTLTTQFWNDFQKATRKERHRLRVLQRHIQADPLLSATEKERTQREVETLCDLLRQDFPQPPQLKAWRKQFGIDKSLNGAPHKHRIWSHIFQALVDVLRPFCRGPKRLSPPQIADKTFVVASRLMALSHPQLWPDRPELVKQRYYYPAAPPRAQS